MFFYKNKNKNWTDEYCVGTGGKKNGNKILNFPTLSRQPNRITTSRIVKKTKTFSIIFIILDFIVKKKRKL